MRAALSIAVVGAGNVGSTLGRRFLEEGHRVTFALREGSDVTGGVPPNAQTAPLANAARDSEIILLATPWTAVPDALASIGGEALAGKILVDATNPIGPGLRPITGANGESGAEQVQLMAPQARVVKAFNTTGFENMANPKYGDLRCAMFVASDDSAAKSTILGLAAAIGFDSIDAGALVRARQLEQLAVLWISLAMSGQGREIAFALLRR